MLQDSKRTPGKRIVNHVKEDRKSIQAQRSSIKFVKKQEDDRARKSLHYSNIEGSFSNAAGSITSSYTTPFALALKASNAEIGMINSLQNLASTLAQIPGAKLSAWLGSRKRAWFFSHITQRILWIPIILLPLIAIGNPVVILAILLFFTSFFASMRSPAWSSLMGDLVQKDRMGKYFGWRNVVTGIAGLFAILAAGEILILFGFSVLFTIALVLGFLSIYFFAKMYEPSFKREYHYTHTIRLKPRDWINSIRINKNFTYFVIFMTAMNFAVGLAAPFFAVYFLKDLNVGYGWYAALIVVEAFVTIISQPYWGKLCDKIGDRKIIVITGILVSFYPAFFFFITSPYEIIVANAFSGFAWAGFNMATFNFMLAAAPPERRAEFTANFSFFTGIGVVIGALTGGILAELLKNSSFMFLVGLQLIFLLSFVSRLACLALLPKLRETRVEERGPPIAEVFWRAVAINPARGIVHLIVHPHYNEWKKDFYDFFRGIWNKTKYKIKMWRNK